MEQNQFFRKMPAGHKVILLLAVFIIIVSGFLLARRMTAYKNAQDEYQTLRNDTVNMTKETVKKEALDNAQVEAFTGEMGQEEIIPINMERSDFPEMTIDFDELETINRDIVAWLYVDAVDLSYPIVQGEDNEYYLTHTFENQKNASGCLFMDCEQNPNLSDYNTFIYGHNMKDGSMFGSLKKLFYIDELAQREPYFYLYTKEGIYQYRIYSCYQDQPDSKSYWKCKTREEYQQYRNAALDKSSVEAAADEMKHLLNAETGYPMSSVVLVTCTGEGASTQRLFVHGQLECMYQEQ